MSPASPLPAATLAEWISGSSPAILWLVAGACMVVVAVFIILGGASALRVLRETRASRKYQVFSDLWREYQSPEMLKALRRLHDFYNECGRNEENLISAYKRLYWSVNAEGPTLHFYRRYVSHFFQKVTALIRQQMLDPGMFYDNWNKSDLRIIPDILVPVEIRALPSLWGETEYTAESMPRRFRRLLELYKGAPED